MKKSIVLAVLGIAAVEMAYGQAGNIFFSNYWSSQQTTGIYYNNGPYKGWGVGNEISVELFYGPGTATTVSQLTGIASSITQVGWGVTSPAPLGTAGGSYAGSGVFSYGPVQVPGTPGDTYAFAIHAFGRLDGIYCDGWSGIYTGPTQATPYYPVPNLPDGLYMGSIAVNLFPEPGTLALCGLGLAALMLFRRKKV